MPEIVFYEMDDFLKMDFPNPRGVGETKNVTRGKWYIENTFADKNAWHLTNAQKDEGTYSMPIKKPMDIIKVLEHFGDKEWVDRGKLLNALMPAIRYFSYGGANNAKP